MATERTNTASKILVPEDNYQALIEKVNRKEIKGGYIIYEWMFEALVGEKPLHFTISMFASQMEELLKALGAKEIAPHDYEWDRELVVGNTISFNVVHEADKKGTIREKLVDIKLLTASPAAQAKEVEEMWK